MRFSLEVNGLWPRMLLLMPDAVFEIDVAEAEHLIQELQNAIQTIQMREEEE